jgi:hypothetical protein
VSRRQRLVGERIDAHHLGARGLQQLAVLGVDEVEGRPPGDGDARATGHGPTDLLGRVPGVRAQRRGAA